MDNENRLSSWSGDHEGTEVDGSGLVDLCKRHEEWAWGANNKWETSLSHVNVYTCFPAQRGQQPSG